MSANHSAVEELDEIRRLALLSQQLEKSLEDAAAAEPPEALPHAVPLAEFRRQGAPLYVVHCKVEDRFEEPAIIVPWLASPGLRGVEHRKHDLPFFLGYLRQHGRPPLPTTQ